jgi:Arc/MetJ-type ribon-helix-helix transcriptional regulator
MTIHLPHDLESFIQAAVHSGRFASVDDAMAEAARLLLREMNNQARLEPRPQATDESPDPVLGCMRDDAELMDEIVADAYRHRYEDTWREFDL